MGEHYRPMPLSDRLARALSDQAEARYLSGDYLRDVRENAHRSHSRLMRRLLFVMLTGGLFWLIDKGSITEADFGIVHINDISIIHKLLPIIISFYFTESAAHTILYLALTNTSAEITRKDHPGLHELGLDYFLEPVGQLTVWKYLYFVRLGSFISRSVRILLNITIGAFVFVPPFFAIYAIYRLFREYGADDGLVWVASALTAIFAGAGLLLSLIAIRREELAG